MKHKPAAFTVTELEIFGYGSGRGGTAIINFLVVTRPLIGFCKIGFLFFNFFPIDFLFADFMQF